MLEAFAWGALAGSSLLVGALVALRWTIPVRVIGWVLAFGSGVLISAVAFDLVEEGYERAGTTPVLIGLGAGALAFAVGDYILSRNGGSDRKRSGGQQAGGAAMAIALGAMLDGIPESAAIGVTLLGGGGVGVAMVAAVFLSNIPESMSAAVGLRKVLTKREITRVLEVLKNGDVATYDDWKGRFQANSEKMRTGDIRAVAEVLKSLTMLSELKPLSYRERKMLDRARFLLISEVAEASNKAADRVESEIDTALTESIKGAKVKTEH